MLSLLLISVCYASVNLIVGVNETIFQLETSGLLGHSELLTDSFKMELSRYFDQDSVESEWETLQLPGNQPCNIILRTDRVSSPGFQTIFQYLVSDRNLTQNLKGLNQSELVKVLNAAEYLGMDSGFYEAIINSISGFIHGSPRNRHTRNSILAL